MAIEHADFAGVERLALVTGRIVCVFLHDMLVSLDFCLSGVCNILTMNGKAIGLLSVLAVYLSMFVCVVCRREP